MMDFKSIAASALACIEMLLAEWLPHGRRDGHEWKSINPTRADKREGSFSINLNTGKWSDFATDDKGGDLISLYAYLHHVPMAEAAKAIAVRLSIALDDAKPNPRPAPFGKGVGAEGERGFVKGGGGKAAGGLQGAPSPTSGKGKSEWEPVLPVPAHAGDPPKAHIKRGKPSAVWTYRDADGHVLGHVYRFVTSDGGKEILPCVWARHAVSGAEEWRWMAFPVARPLYGLDRLAAHPETSVMVVEGEKCADAFYGVFPERPAVTWPGGCKAADKADWSPLAGRDVIIWPDFDDPGRAAARRIAEYLAGLGCKVRVVEVPAADDHAAGWDVADAVAEGWDKKRIGQFIVDHVREPKKMTDPTPAGASRVSTRGGEGGEGDEWRELLFRKDGKLTDCRENIHTILMNHPMWQGVIWTDAFAHTVVRRRPAPWDNPTTFIQGLEWQKHDDLRLGKWLAQQEGLLVRNVDNLSLAIGWAASEESAQWHPVRDYLEGLQWDGVPRLDHWLSTWLGIKRSEYTRLSGRMFLIGMVARIYRSGCVMRSMPILEGAQYVGKSTVLRILGGDWFSDTPIDLKNKDSYLMIQGRWLYEIAELDTFNRAETSSIKAFISSTVDHFRAPYERAVQGHPRQVVFCGTVNGDEYFKDETGNTRYWPLRVEEIGRIDLDGLASVRDQLFAEAVHLFKQGQRWHPTREEQKKLFDPEQEARVEEDAWRPYIDNYLRNNRHLETITIREVITDCLKIEVGKIDRTKNMSKSVGRILKQLGWVRKQVRKGVSRLWIYVRPEGYGKDEGEDDACPF